MGERKPMIFNSEPAFRQLRQEKWVITARSTKRNIGPVWIRKTRTGEKEFDAEIIQVATIEPVEDLETLTTTMRKNGWVEFSGFNTAEEWVEEIKNLNDGNIPSKLYFHKVIQDNYDDR